VPTGGGGGATAASRQELPLGSSNAARVVGGWGVSM